MYIQEIMMELLLQIAEVGCYSGVTLSAVIAWKLFRMEKLTWFNKMFLYYLILDVIFGNAETYLFFKLYRERWDLHQFQLDKTLNIILHFNFAVF